MTREPTPDGPEDREPTAEADAGAEAGADPAHDDVGEEDPDDGGDLPASVADEAERLTRLARRAVDDAEAAAYRDERAELLADHGFTARLRTEGGDATLVCHPEAWVVDGDVHPERIEEIDRAVERPLDGAADVDDWAAVDERNRELASRVAEEHGDRHGANARAFGEFMSNHYARPVDQATPAMREEFLEDYYPRNAWPTEAQRAVVERSLDLLRDVADDRREDAGSV